MSTPSHYLFYKKHLLLFWLVFPFFTLNAQDCSNLFITEIMYDPASSNTTIWEYVEIYNADTSSFDLSGAVLDDMAGAILSSSNVGNGLIPPLSTVVLFNDDNTLENFQNAWGDSILFIPVSNWGILNNGGDRVALWCSIETYNSRDFDTAITSVYYDGGGIWPVHNGIGAIELSCSLPSTCDLNNGNNWHLNNGATFSNPVGENMLVNHGSPGIFPNPQPLFTVVADRFEFIPSPPTLGEVEVDFAIIICATNGTDIQLDYDRVITLNDNFSTANYTIESAQTLHPLKGCVTYNIRPHSIGEIKVIIGNDDFESLPAHISIMTTSTTIIPSNNTQNLNIYPTFATDFLTVEMKKNVHFSTSLKIFDRRGTLVLISPFVVGSSKKTIDISIFSSGIYFVQMGKKVARFFKE